MPAPPVTATPVAFARAIAEAYRRRGLSPHAALARAGVAPVVLAQADACITARQMEWLSDAAMRELDDEGLGCFSRRLPWGSYGMLARASISAPTLHLALKRWCRHHGLIADDLRLSVQSHGDRAELLVREVRPLPRPLREFALVHVLRNALGLACWLIDSRIALAASRFPFAPPPHAQAYDVLFPGPVSFGAGEAALRFDARYLALPLARDEAALSRMLQHALPLTVRPYQRDRLLVARLRQALLAHPGEPHTAEAAARWLHVSPSTLHRHLRAEGSSLQLVKDGLHREAACELLVRGRQPLKQVARVVGFASDKAFIRAFKTWTGQTPQAYREAASGEASDMFKQS